MRGAAKRIVQWPHECCMVFFGGSRSAKPWFFPCQVAAGGDEGYLVCAAVAASIVPGANRFSLGVLQRAVAHVFVVVRCFGIRACVTFCCVSRHAG